MSKYNPEPAEDYYLPVEDELLDEVVDRVLVRYGKDPRRLRRFLARLQRRLKGTTTMPRRKTYTPTYWSSNGKYQKDYEQLWEKLVPPEGHAKTYAGELLRSISKIYYDLFNNGFGNGPFTAQWGLLKEHWRDLEKLSGNPRAIAKFAKAFAATNYGEYIVDSDGIIMDGRYVRGDEYSDEEKEELATAPYDAFDMIRFNDEVYEGLDLLTDAVVQLVKIMDED